MSLKKHWIKYSFFAIVIILFVLFMNFVYPKSSMITGYSAKDICSCTFISQRDQRSIEAEDTGFSPISLAKSTIDHEKKSVTSTVFGLQKRTAYYHEGYGCVLDNDHDPTNNDLQYKAPFRNQGYTTSKSWPYGTVQKDTLFDNVNYFAIKDAVSEFFDKENSDPNLKTRSVLVVYKDQIIAEKYSHGFDKNTGMIGWSMTKSILHTLYGILEKENNFDIYKPAPIEEWKNDERSKITVHDLLQMNSGLEWDEDYSNISDVTHMLFLAKDISINQKNKTLKFPIQSHFNYSSGTSNLLSNILRKEFKTHQEYLNFPYKMLFNKLGMRSMVMETDMSGNYIASSYSFATTRDWAKYGLLYLHDGVWENERILPEGWVKYAATPNGTSEGRYGAHFWLNNGRYPDLPQELYSANGFQGQRVFIIPSKDLVIVRTGYASMTNEQYNGFISQILKGIKNK